MLSTTKLPYNPDEPLNDLERALLNAAKDPMTRPHFYKSLLASDVYYLTSGDGRSVFQWAFPDSTDDPPTQIFKIPVFTSMERAAEEMLIQQQEPQMVGKTTGRKILEMAAQNEYSVWLTAGKLGCGKDFLPHEYASMMAANGTDDNLAAANHSVTFPAGSELAVGQPAEYPTELVAFLQRIFAERPHVRAAYLARLVQTNATNSPGHVDGDALVGIEVDRMPLDEEMMQGIVEWIKDQVPGKVYDFDAWAMVDATDDEMDQQLSPIQKYMKLKTKPFYVAAGGEQEQEEQGLDHGKK